MELFLAHPAVQAGVAPFFVGLVVALALGRLRLGGLAAAAGFATAVLLINGAQFSPLTASRKIMLIGLAAPVIGIIVDFVFRPNRALLGVLVALAALLPIWVLGPVLAQKEAAQAWLLGSTAVLCVGLTTGAHLWVHDRPIRAGAAALMLGLGSGIGSILGASATYGTYGVALAAGAGAFLLPQMVSGKPGYAGATLALSAGLTTSLLGAGAMVLAQVPWYALPALMLIPFAALLPVSKRLPVWSRAVILSLYGLVPALAAFALIWRYNGLPPG